MGTFLLNSNTTDLDDVRIFFKKCHFIVITRNDAINERMRMDVKNLDRQQVIKRLCKKQIKTNYAAKVLGIFLS